jgi:hypothetical protein
MHKYLPVDLRARTTFNSLFIDYVALMELDEFRSIEGIAKCLKIITDHLPIGIAHKCELQFKINRYGASIKGLKNRILEIIKKSILSLICEDLHNVFDEIGDRVFYYTREDIILWYKFAGYPKYVKAPDEEIVTIEIKYDTIVKSSNVTLTKEQLLGIIHGLYGVNDNHITLRSSIINDFIKREDMVKYTYNLAKSVYPYYVDILQPNGNYSTINFLTPEFMQGILSVAKWTHRNDIWKNLYQLIDTNRIILDI